MQTLVGATTDGRVQRVPNSLEGGESALRALLDLPEAPTAIITSTDLVAVGVLHAAHTLGRVVPAELSVVGFDDLVLAAHTVPALTTVHMPIEEIVAAGIGRAIDLARDPLAPRGPTITVFEPGLVIRQSTARPATS